MKRVKLTQLRAATTAGAGDMAATGTHRLQHWGGPFKVVLTVSCANAYAFTVTFRKNNASGGVLGEIAVSQSTTPANVSANFDPSDVQDIHWTIVGTAPVGAISLVLLLLEAFQKIK